MLGPFQSVAPTTGPTTDGGTEGSLTFGWPESELRFSYPAAWTKEPAPFFPARTFKAFPGVSESTDTDFADNVTVIMYPDDRGVAKSADSMTLTAVAVYRTTMPGMDVIGNAETQVGGVDARRLTLAGTLDDREMKCQFVYVVHANNGYVFGCFADAKDFDKVQAGLDQLLKTVKWKD